MNKWDLFTFIIFVEMQYFVIKMFYLAKTFTYYLPNTKITFKEIFLLKQKWKLIKNSMNHFFVILYKVSECHLFVQKTSVLYN